MHIYTIFHHCLNLSTHFTEVFDHYPSSRHVSPHIIDTLFRNLLMIEVADESGLIPNLFTPSRAIRGLPTRIRIHLMVMVMAMVKAKAKVMEMGTTIDNEPLPSIMTHQEIPLNCELPSFYLDKIRSGSVPFLVYTF